jgi:signal transduction histidine kinase
VLDNLISNAVKYSPQGKEINVRLGTASSMVRFEVADQGPGDQRRGPKTTFGKFARLSAKPTGGENATGRLGLSIVKRMVEAMSGKGFGVKVSPAKAPRLLQRFKLRTIRCKQGSAKL